ncbi:hypothetical protein CN151_04490 [Sinorhizobium meliloti]|uniref:SnoaL-like domain-containing protein n=3 Tax=Rhizobium meliloti TaxID=382 RepID=A0A6A7ZRI3_RHIML|nr:nuclear transport factor 2 family protein [Sinorhizobium meliloti]AEH82936.1 hypothetical protein SM11_pD0103 [Sinorhizobium meliloti SM11]ASJ63751.1 hypothetical protein SMB554_33020 [Sinorhizobium meliloti]ASP55741.1 hypothetical protein CDO31_31035 [Sinorhizobium meliloti]ASP75656.1 hypothetical protein CDO28_30335 [Sinorhizobium meliloti]ASP89210.1 hypothetical protein CDO26_33845 [Sinorhizobium meliloti]
MKVEVAIIGAPHRAEVTFLLRNSELLAPKLLCSLSLYLGRDAHSHLGVPMQKLTKCLFPAAVLALGMPVAAAAQDCPTADDWKDAPTISGVDNDERNAVSDLLARYAWAMNNRQIDALKALFADGGSYVFCQMGKRTPDESYSSKDGIGRHFEAVFRPLTDNGLNAKRVLTGHTIDNRGQDINVTMVAIVFIQNFDSPLPQLDYFADIFVTIDRATKLIKRLVVTPGDGRVSIRAR